MLWTLPALVLPFFVTLVAGVLLHLQASSETLPGPIPFAFVMLAPFPVPLLLQNVALVAVVVVLAVLVRLGRPTMSALVLIGVWAALSGLTTLQYGVLSFWPALLVLPICAAALLLGEWASVAAAFLATTLVLTAAWLHGRGLLIPLPPVGAPPAPPPPPEMLAPAPAEPTFILNRLPPPWMQGVVWLALGYWTGLYWTVAVLASLLAGGLRRALQQSRAHAEALGALSAQLEARVAAQTAELAQRAARAEALYDVARALTSTLELPGVIALITEQAARLLRFDAALVLLAEADDERFALVGAYPRDAIWEPLLATHERTLHAVHERRAPTVLRWTTGAGAPRAALVLPMVCGRDVAGVLVLVERGDGAERSADDLALAEGFASQAAVAIANARLLAQAREAATLEERARLAREIHDTLAQGLTSVVVQLGAAERALRLAPDQAREHLALAQRMARESLTEARRSVWNLRAAALERGELAHALRALTARPAGTDLASRFELIGEPAALPPRAEAALLRVCQEALVNVVKHARARSVLVRLEYGEAAVRLTVQDDGVGFAPDVLAARAPAAGAWPGFGLLGMRERLEALGGTLELANAGGARVVASMPRRRAAPPGQPAVLVADNAGGDTGQGGSP